MFPLNITSDNVAFCKCATPGDSWCGISFRGDWHILRIDLDLYLIAGDKGLSSRSQVLAIPVNSLDDTTLGEGEVIYLLPVEIGTCHDLDEQAGTPFGTEGWSRDHLVIENHVKGLYL